MPDYNRALSHASNLSAATTSGKNARGRTSIRSEMRPSLRSMQSSLFAVSRSPIRIHTPPDLFGRAPDMYGRYRFDHLPREKPTDLVADITDAVRDELKSFKETLTKDTIGPVLEHLTSISRLMHEVAHEVPMVPIEQGRNRPGNTPVLQPSSAHATAGEQTVDGELSPLSAQASRENAIAALQVTLRENAISAEAELACKYKFPETFQPPSESPAPEGYADDDASPKVKSKAIMFKPAPSHVFPASFTSERSTGGESSFSEPHDNCLSPHSASRGSLNRSATWGHLSRRVGRRFGCVAGNVERCKCATMAWKAMEDPDSGFVAWLYSRVMFTLITSSVILIFVQKGERPVLGEVESAATDIFFDTLFAIELAVRFACCPNRCAFMLNPHNQIDFIAFVVASWFHSSMASGTQANYHLEWGIEVIDCLRVITRMLKMLGRFQNFHLLISATFVLQDALVFHMFLMLTIAIVFTVMIYLVEPAGSITMPRALWLTIVTMTTVGYGDITTQTTLGNFISGFLMIGSTFYMAVPVGIVGTVFSRIWDDRLRLLVMKKSKDFLMKSGYSAEDIPGYFHSYSNEEAGDGLLDFDGFSRMLSDMGIGLDDFMKEELFNVLDCDGSGLIDEFEFMRVLFPRQYQALYGKASGARYSCGA